MNPTTRNTYRQGLSFRLHEEARHQRARAIGALFARLVGRLSALRPPQLPAARWG